MPHAQYPKSFMPITRKCDMLITDKYLALITRKCLLHLTQKNVQFNYSKMSFIVITKKCLVLIT